RCEATSGLLGSSLAESKPGQLVRRLRQCVDLTNAEHLVVEQQPGRRRDPALHLGARNVETQVGQYGRGTAESDLERTGLAGESRKAVLVLHDAVEKHREEAAVNQSGRAFVDQRKGDAAGRGLGVEVVEMVFRKAGVERTDVGRVVEIDAPAAIVVRTDSRGALRRNRRAQLAFPIADLRQDRVHRRVGMFQGQQQRAESADRAGGGDGLGERRFAESRAGPCGNSPRLLFAHRPSSPCSCSVAGLSLLSYTAQQLYSLL